MITPTADALLSQMRGMATQATGQITGEAAKGNIVDKNVGKTGFGDALMSSINKINDMKVDAKNQTQAFQMGDPNVELHNVMIDNQKAGLAFDVAVQVRNKAVSAYKEMMNMQV